MPEIKSIHPVREMPRTFSLLDNQNNDANLRLQLRREIDRLALLIEELKRQGERVLAVADAVGDRMLTEHFENAPLKRVPRLVRPDGRK